MIYESGKKNQKQYKQLTIKEWLYNLWYIISRNHYGAIKVINVKPEDPCKVFSKIMLDRNNKT
jgi:hypothetical protein